MRWLSVCGLVAVVACGGEDRPVSTAETPQQLVIPPMDAGAHATPPTPTVAPPLPDPGEQADTNEIAERDKRLARSSVRAPADVAQMIQGMEQGLITMPANDPRAAMTLRLLADLYEELATLSRETAVVRAARKKEAEHFGSLINNYPASPQVDEARYFRALSFERLGDLSNARKGFYDLIKSHPTSKYIPGAYFAFGELFFDEAKNDPSKWELAKQAFLEVLKYPPPANELFPFALLRMGEIAKAQGDLTKERSNFDRLRHDFPGSNAVKRIPTDR